ncbi:MAG: hypothetical protein EP347_04460 [Alphaproteobacteria bacterium]|nr:MAG: hypothetical protein EP347_04460 [Alphaproteobacteria bacterium]
MTNRFPRKLRHPLAAIAILASMATPALADEETTESDDNNRVCFYSSAVNKFEPIDEFHLMVTAHGSKKFLLTLVDRCYDLPSTPQIVFIGNGERVCNYTRHRIATGRDRCTINDIEKVDSFEEAEEIAQAHQQEWKENRNKDKNDEAEEAAEE